MNKWIYHSTTKTKERKTNQKQKEGTEGRLNKWENEKSRTTK